MKEIELRLALVLYGGVSLAVYMHGVSREVLAMVRASNMHRLSRFTQAPGSREDEDPAILCAASAGASPVEAAWQRVFDDLAETVEVRVVVDALSGASAGGVNAIMLARALAHDLPLTDHRAMWLENADVTRLAKPQDGLSRYFKRTVSPVIDRLVGKALKSQIDDEETREKLRAFVQSRWFTPPFSGERFASWMLDACARMDENWCDRATLLPRGQRLDLFVTLTDYHGERRKVLLGSTATLEETEHRRILHFSAQARATRIESNLGRRNVADVVFAARATASFPGTFPPATIAEMDALLDERGESWPERDHFLRKTLGVDPEAPVPPVFVDGSVVMNKPFAPVIEAIRDRPAMREVARRLIYVDPVPETARRQADRESVPGFFRIILASLAHIPRNEPIGDDLAGIEEGNRKARHLSDLIAASEPLVEREVERILERETDGSLTARRVRACRRQANEAAHQQAGFMHMPYLKLKMAALGERLAGFIAGLIADGGDPAVERMLNERITDYLHALEEAPGDKGDSPAVPLPLTNFLRGLDVDYRIRRLRFVIRRLNTLYTLPDLSSFEGTSEQLDDLKGTLYAQIEHLSQYWRPSAYDAEVRRAAHLLVASPADNLKATKTFLDHLAEIMSLDELDLLHDDIVSAVDHAFIAPRLRRRFSGAYIGFAFYDLITFPVMQRQEITEVNEVLVDRISAADPGALSETGTKLKGASLSLFGAFFNRAWREHDYLWGRLNAADKLLSTVIGAVGDRKPANLDTQALRRGLFEAILEEEAEHLRTDPHLISDIRALIEDAFHDARAPRTSSPDAASKPQHPRRSAAGKGHNRAERDGPAASPETHDDLHNVIS
ncbi:patatin-like protein [Breoghania sp.]|uniref:patatin-like protein n=1 Tax=Breoghania sp. TaxID=2065378 RepID=UPI0029CA5C44|nr:patatin-like protein [Breoghania sp.]